MFPRALPAVATLAGIAPRASPPHGVVHHYRWCRAPYEPRRARLPVRNASTDHGSGPAMKGHENGPIVYRGL